MHFFVFRLGQACVADVVLANNMQIDFFVFIDFFKSWLSVDPDKVISIYSCKEAGRKELQLATHCLVFASTVFCMEKTICN